MDIAKIRKKAKSKEKEKDADEKTIKEPAETEKEAAEKELKDNQHVDVDAADTGNEEFKEDDGRQEAVAQEQEKKEEDTEEDQLVEILTFSLAKEELAFRVSEVEEIIRYQKITRVPSMPDFVLGITSLRGKIIPVIDLKKRLGLRKSSISNDYANEGLDLKSETKANEKILIVSGPNGLIGASIDRVIGVVRLPVSNMLEPPAHLTEEELKFIEGVVIFENRFISVIRAKNTMHIEAT
jgi:purine-binding chemotaxis protein CheW